MFTVTKKAAAALKQMLEEAEGRPEGHVFRIDFDDTDRMGLVWDKPATGDRLLKVNNETVLVVDADIWDSLDDIVMDVDETPGGPQLSLTQQAGLGHGGNHSS